MFKFIVIAILLINSIFWGVYPVNEFSPHQKILNKLKLSFKITTIFHILLGTMFYLLALFISHSYIL
jgi:hypothetical protein